MVAKKSQTKKTRNFVGKKSVKKNLREKCYTNSSKRGRPRKANGLSRDMISSSKLNASNNRNFTDKSIKDTFKDEVVKGKTIDGSQINLTSSRSKINCEKNNNLKKKQEKPPPPNLVFGIDSFNEIFDDVPIMKAKKLVPHYTVIEKENLPLKSVEESKIDKKTFISAKNPQNKHSDDVSLYLNEPLYDKRFINQFAIDIIGKPLGRRVTHSPSKRPCCYQCNNKDKNFPNNRCRISMQNCLDNNHTFFYEKISESIKYSYESF